MTANSKLMYFDYAAIAGLRPEQVFNAVTKSLRWVWGNPGRGNHPFSLEAERTVFSCRSAIAKTFNLQDERRIAFTQNCTEALNLAIKGILKKGDEVVTTSMEHNSVLRPLKLLESTGLIKLHIVDGNEFGFVQPDKLLAFVNSKTALVVMNHVSNVNGAIQDIATVGNALKKEKTAFLVDASQSAGSLPIDMKGMGIDLLAVPGHKYLMAPVGASFLAFSEKAEPEPLIVGGTGSFSSDLVQPHDLPDRYQSGTMNVSAIAGLLAGLEFNQAKKKEIADKSLQKRFYNSLDFSGKLGLAGFSGNPGLHQPVFSLFHKEGKEDELAEALVGAGFIVRYGLHCAPLAHKTLGTGTNGTVRVSFGFYTEEEEVDSLIGFLNSRF